MRYDILIHFDVSLWNGSKTLFEESCPKSRRPNAGSVFSDRSSWYARSTIKNTWSWTFSGYKYVTENCHRDLKWASFLDDETIIDEDDFNRLIITTENENQGKPDEKLRHPYCLAGLEWSKSGVVRPDNCFILEYKERFFIIHMMNSKCTITSEILTFVSVVMSGKFSGNL